MGRSPWQNKNLGKKTSIIIFLYKKNLLAGGQKYPPFFYFYCPLCPTDVKLAYRTSVLQNKKLQALGQGYLPPAAPRLLFLF